MTEEKLEKLGFHFKGGICPEATKGNVLIGLDGSDVCYVEINGVSIEELRDIPECQDYFDELCYRLSEDDWDFILSQALETENGKPVSIPTETKEHMAAHSDVKVADICEAINKITLDEGKSTFFMETIGLGRIVGKDHCVYVPEDKRNEITMEPRPNREGATPMIEMEPADTSEITVGICFDEGKWQLFTAFYGVKAPKEPWDNFHSEAERKESEEFWACHALCKGE